VTVTLTPQRDLDLEVWSEAAQSVLQRDSFTANRLARSAKVGTARESVKLTNRGTHGFFVYVNATLGRGTLASNYALAVSTKPLPKPKPTKKKR
jgi:hypothetical protein